MSDLETRLGAADFGAAPRFKPPDDVVDVGLAWMDSPIAQSWRQRDYILPSRL